MCHHLDDREWQGLLEEEREAEPTESTDDMELTDEPERREPIVPSADD